MEQAASRIIQCPECGVQNRIPAERIGSEAKCGRCHAPLPSKNDDAGGATYVIRCRECAAKNRVPSNKLNDQPKCGKCGAELRTHELFEPQPMLISGRNFLEKVLNSPVPVMVFAMSPSCPTCVVVAPQIEAIAREYKGRLRVGRLNVQSNPELAARFNILSVPYLLFFDQGHLRESLPGALDKEQFTAVVSRHLY
jgi:thioredoxin 2